ncbi:MAG: AbrB/MazE/SpoVT family DNA-binding domain-containing protein, partial [Halobacteriales archaeon]
MRILDMDRSNPEPIERKVQLAGGSTFTVSLPQEWGTTHEIKKGDTIYLYQDRDRLIIAPSQIKRDTQTARIDTTDLTTQALEQRI